MSRKNDIKRLIVNHERRLQKLKEQQAIEGRSADPKILIEIEDIEKTIDWDDLSDKSERWIWYYEAGAAAHNVLIQATARNLAGNIVPIKDKNAICSILGLSNDKFDPIFIVPVG